jgi:hypothetical protein
MEHIKHKTKRVMSINDNNTYSSRFRIVLFLLRMGGHPLKMKSTSRIHTAYNVALVVCFSFTITCVCMDTFVHRRNLVYAMKKLRLFIGMILVTWIHISFR